MAGSRGAERILNSDKTQFDKEQTDLVKFILNERFFKPWSLHQTFEIDDNLFDYSLIGESALEIYLTAKCNQKCEYCYLHRFPGLYPAEYDKQEIVLHNLQLLFDYIIENDFYIPSIEYFTGEIWHSEYGLKVLEMTLQAVKNGLRTDSFTIPSNCSFVADEIQLGKIQRYIDALSRQGVRLVFSISVDGAPVEDFARPLNNGWVKTEEFYDRLFLFAQHNTYYFHPMVAACDIEKWIENFQWWENKCIEYDMDPDVCIMMLEVRNNDWTQEKIESYCKLLDYFIDRQWKNNDYNIERFCKELFNYQGGGLHGYVPYAPARSDTFPGCTVANSLTVRAGDLAICPCHRTAYNKFLYGRFVVENDKICDIEGYNPQMAMRILMSNFNLTNFGCDTCIYSKYCLKGCLGSQYETTGDPFMPMECVCKFFKAKLKFLANKYNELGVYDWVRENARPEEEWYLRIQEWLQFAEEVIKDGE